MTIVIILLVIAVLLGIAGAIILILGLNNKKNIMLISGGIMLLFTVLFCAGAILYSARGPMNRECDPVIFHSQMPDHECFDMAREKCDKYNTDIPKGYHCDSAYVKK
jgi:hypothetical protein